MDTEKSKIEDYALMALRARQREDYKILDKQMAMGREDVFNDMSFGRLAMTIPDDHYELLTMAFPLLQCKDAVEKTKEWKRVSRMDICLPYLVNKNQRGV